MWKGEEKSQLDRVDNKNWEEREQRERENKKSLFNYIYTRTITITIIKIRKYLPLLNYYFFKFFKLLFFHVILGVNCS